jgi:sugar phosphate isomerase/epimerase
MRIGFPNHPRREVLAEIAWIGEHGFDFVDLFLEPDRAAIEEIDPKAVRAALEERGLIGPGHLAWYLPLGSPLPQMRSAAVHTAGEYLHVFAEIGVPAVTVHAHWPPHLFPEEDGLRWQIESLQALLAAAGELGVALLYEPIDTEHDTAEHLAVILEALPDLGCHLDLGHCHLHGRSPAAMLRQFGARLRHLHVHDNNGREDLHLPPGAGTINWTEVAAALHEIGYNGTATLEVFSRDRDYVLLAKRKLEALW